MFRHGSKEGNKRKQSVGPGVWDIGVQDFYGFLDVPTDVSLQDRVGTKGNLAANPPAKQQRLEQVPPSLPGDSAAEFLCFGASSCGETAEDKLDKIRAKNRQAQERFRAKKKAEEKAIQDHMNKMKNEIALAQQEVAMKKQLALSLGARGVAASTQLAHVHSQLSQLSVSKFASRRTSSSNSAPARKSLPLTAWMSSKFGNPSHAHVEENADVFMPALENTCSPIFQANSSVPRPCNSFKYQERISLRHISTVPGSSALARTKHYKATVAHRLGCSVTDICWRMDSVRVPELTGPDGMSTHFGTIECAPKLFLAFICSLIEYSASLHLLGRLEQDMDIFSCDDNLDPSPFSNGKMQYTVPPPQRTTSDCSDSTSTNTFHAARMDDAFTSAMGLEPTNEVPGPVEWSSATETSDTQTTELLALSIFPKLLTSYISRMHPDDAAALCVQLSTLVQHFHAPAEDPKLDEFTALVNSKIFAIMKSLDAAVQHAQLGLASKSMYKPLTKDATKREIARIHRTIKDVTTEWHFILLMSQMDAGRQIRTMALQICNPVSNGYVKFEEQNVKAYAAIDMTFEQKQELAFVWDVFKQESAAVGKSRESICQMLATLPNSKDLHVGDMRAMKANLVALNAKVNANPSSNGTSKNSAPAPAAATTKPPTSENKASSEAEDGNCAWVQKLIGVSPEVTEIAENALTALHDMQKRLTELYSEIGEVYMNVLTPKQNAIWLTVLMPSLGDIFRVADMATTDVRQQRMFNNNIASLVHNPDEASTRARERALLYKAGLENPLPISLK